MKSPLKHHDEFEKILKNYSVSASAASLLHDTKLVLLLAPSSTGRNTTIKYLITTGKYHYIVSDTTRQPRINDGVPEVNGREYWFKSENEFLEGLRAGQYLEAEIIHQQQVSGISIRELEKAKDEQKVAITDVDIQGVHNILKSKPDAVVILLLPPTFEEWQRRIMSRGHMGHAELHRRFSTALRIFDDALHHDFYKFVIADKVERSAGQIGDLADGRPNIHQSEGRELISHLKLLLEEKIKTL